MTRCFSGTKPNDVNTVSVTRLEYSTPEGLENCYDTLDTLRDYYRDNGYHVLSNRDKNGIVARSGDRHQKIYAYVVANWKGAVGGCNH